MPYSWNIGAILLQTETGPVLSLEGEGQVSFLGREGKGGHISSWAILLYLKIILHPNWLFFNTFTNSFSFINAWNLHYICKCFKFAGLFRNTEIPSFPFPYKSNRSYKNSPSSHYRSIFLGQQSWKSHH